jgi:hypothetical protein
LCRLAARSSHTIELTAIVIIQVAFLCVEVVIFFGDARFPLHNRFYIFRRRSQWPRGLGHELYSLARTLKLWARIPLKARAFILCLCCPVFR